MSESGVVRLKTLLDGFDRVGMLRLPTPLEPMKRLSAFLGGPRLWVKREDCTGFGFGGNKLRKLDFLLAEAIAQGANTLVSGGVVQSNSQRQVAAAAARLGMECRLAVYHGRVVPSGAAYKVSGNVLLNKLFGALTFDVPWDGDRNAAIRALAESARIEGRKPYVVPYGASSALGAVGYATAALEIAGQCDELGFMPTSIVHCSGSGGTQAGMSLGAAVCLPMTEVLGVDIDAEPERVERDVVDLSSKAASLLGVEFNGSRIHVVAGHAGPSYGVPHAATLEAIALAGRLEALPLDPVYSGKGLAGLIALVRDGRWRSDENVVFVHTGGEPALFAYEAALSAGLGT